MGLKKRSKVSAEFSMSSLTDIIFLLLIFFMLTSSLVSPHALNIKLPGGGNPSTASSNPPEVVVSRSGKVSINGRTIKEPVRQNVLRALRQLDDANGSKKLDVILSPHRSAPVEGVVLVMDVCHKMGIEPILAAEK